MGEVRAYKREQDAATLQAWAQHRQMNFNADLMPPNGFIYSLDGEDVAALFVYFIYGTPVAQIATLFSNPNAGMKFTRALKSLFRCATTFIQNYAKMSNTPIVAIQCNLRKDIVEAFKMKQRKDWIISDHDYASCFYVLNNE